jgi:hypothetical protein
MKDINKQLDAVVDWPSFAAFVRALAADRREAERLEKENPEKYYPYCGALGWENVEISAFLDATVRCVEDGAHGNPIPETPNWRFVANLISGGKFYE